ncbi:putative chorismate synthase [Besnoitia besnoiti]|uniref:chorismate synthase n=1 Tax=Besnoitia besnoiti TaxID=94643 RepID=A0A2A9M2N5_BESBE|nr:putative chorismate synthase [Besnoitia besnoiti]PFH32748.1 putative chorismate synthase [Besnoitia besnoiti]
MSSFGAALRVSTFGESHGSAVGCIIDGLPPRLPLSVEDVQPQLNRRRPGQGPVSTQRAERDRAHILSGVEDGYTLGSPVAILVWNEDRRPEDYGGLCTLPRPGHGDFAYHAKYHIHARSGGGRSSARETLARVAAGAVVEKWLRRDYGTTVTAWVCQVGDVAVPDALRRKWRQTPPTREAVDSLGRVRVSLDGATYLDAEGRLYDAEGQAITQQDEIARRRRLFGRTAGAPAEGETVVDTRCPCASTAVKMVIKIKQIRELGDSIGGCVSCAIVQPPVGLGEPCFDKVEAELAKAMMSLPATKGFEIGQGFASVTMRGSEHNDPFVPTAMTARRTPQLVASPDPPPCCSPAQASTSAPRSPRCPLPSGAELRLRCGSNNAGGTLAGITSGENILFRVAFKPVSSIGMVQETADFTGEVQQLAVKGRHDPCVLPRAPPLVESMAALVVGDLCMRQRAREGPQPLFVLRPEDGRSTC